MGYAQLLKSTDYISFIYLVSLLRLLFAPDCSFLLIFYVLSKPIVIMFSELRVSYRDKKDVLLEDNLESKNPHQLFSIWFKKALERDDVRQPNAACLATATK